jgi:hypothetical protein
MCGGGGGNPIRNVLRAVANPIAAIANPVGALGTAIAGQAIGAGTRAAAGAAGLTPDIPQAPAPQPRQAEAPRAPTPAATPREPRAAEDPRSPESRSRRRRAAAAGRGRAGTILTSPRGVTQQAPVATKTLLGQ